MKKKIIFVSHNKSKIKEIKQILGEEFEVITLTDLGITEEIPETGKNYYENASIKANYVYNKYQCDCFADDSGIEFETLKGEPGVFSARWAGENATGDDLVNKSLKLLSGRLNRFAIQHTTVIAYINGKKCMFEGDLSGYITYEAIGDNGFAYDKIFSPSGSKRTLAAMTDEEKSDISHRGIAVRKMKDYIIKEYK